MTLTKDQIKKIEKLKKEKEKKRLNNESIKK
jgi:hypothetical protein